MRNFTTPARNFGHILTKHDRTYRWFERLGRENRVNFRSERFIFRRNRRDTIPMVETLEQKTLMTVTYHGGDVLSRPGVQPLFLGSDWYDYNNENLANAMSDFLYTLVNSTYMDTLNQYGVFNGSYGTGYIEPYLLSSSISDPQIQWVITQSIRSGEYYQGNLIVVYTPPGVVVFDGNQNSVNNFTGYHSSFLYYNGYGFFPVAYAVITYPTYPNANPYYTLTTGQEMTAITAHEVAEACTDPYISLGYPAWYDNYPPYPQSIAGVEIGDLAWGDMSFLDGYIVQDIVNIYDQPDPPPGSSAYEISMVNSEFPINLSPFDAAPKIIIAQFFDPDIILTTSNPNSPMNYTVTINWGDGTGLSYGVVEEIYPGVYQIFGYHYYSIPVESPPLIEYENMIITLRNNYDGDSVTIYRYANLYGSLLIGELSGGQVYNAKIPHSDAAYSTISESQSNIVQKRIVSPTRAASISPNDSLGLFSTVEKTTPDRASIPMIAYAPPIVINRKHEVEEIMSEPTTSSRKLGYHVYPSFYYILKRH
jgi:hypothetical protein